MQTTLNETIQIAETLKGETLGERTVQKNDMSDFEKHWDDIVGQHGAKRALEIAAAGGHHLLMVGPVGSGKALLAKAMLDILPPMSKDETMEVSKVYSTIASPSPVGRPFRAPHYATSIRAMLGGGAGENIVPGEVTLANKGILFIDQWPDMPKAMAEALRGPVEDKKITISRLKSKVDYPTDFQLVVGAYPCPCGYYGTGDRCTCTTGQRLAYMSKLSGPVIDMVDVQVWVNANLPNNNDVKREPASAVAERVARARARQIERQGKLNGALTSRELPELGENSKDMTENIMAKMGFSARAWSRMLKIARTIADLDDCEAILPQHIAEAASFRFLDRMDK